MTLNHALRLRRAARLIVLDPQERTLMFRYDGPGRPPFWVTAGVECEPAGAFVRLAYSRQRTVEEGAEGLRRACGYYHEGDGAYVRTCGWMDGWMDGWVQREREGRPLRPISWSLT